MNSSLVGFFSLIAEEGAKNAHKHTQLNRAAITWPAVDRVFALNQVGDAHRYMEQNRNFGKIVLSTS